MRSQLGLFFEHPVDAAKGDTEHDGTQDGLVDVEGPRIPVVETQANDQRHHGRNRTHFRRFLPRHNHHLSFFRRNNLISGPPLPSRLPGWATAETSFQPLRPSAFKSSSEENAATL